MLFSLTDLGSFIDGVGKTVSDTVTSIKLNTPYIGGQYPNQVSPYAVAQPGGLLAGGLGTLLLIGAIAYFIFKR